jgi:hypothetical protein
MAPAGRGSQSMRRKPKPAIALLAAAKRMLVVRGTHHAAIRAIDDELARVYQLLNADRPVSAAIAAPTSAPAPATAPAVAPVTAAPSPSAAPASPAKAGPVVTTPAPQSALRNRPTGAVTPAAQAASRVVHDDRRRACDEAVLLALVKEPLKLRALRIAASGFSAFALEQSLKRLITAGEIRGEGQTIARVYSLIQRRSTPTPAPAAPQPAGRTHRSEGTELESVWPLPGNPKAPLRALVERGQEGR